jgi:hypothetical protein
LHIAAESGQLQLKEISFGDGKRPVPGRVIRSIIEVVAIRFGPGAVAKPLRRMIADLLEAHQERKHDPFAPHTLRPIERIGEFLDRFLVERRLRRAQATERFHLRLVGKVGDHRLVGLEAPYKI